MPSVFSVSIAKIIKEIRLQEVYLPRTADEILISSRDIDRPGVQIAGFYDYYDQKRVQVLGRRNWLCSKKWNASGVWKF